MSFNVLGVDQSLTVTAWVLMDDTYKVLEEGVIRTTNEDTLQERCVAISSGLTDVFRCGEVDSFSIEGLSYGSIGNATRNLAVLFGHIQATCYDYHFLEGTNKWLETPATSLKKFATGSGRADKKDMLAAVPEPYQQYLRDNFKGTGKKSGLKDLPDAYWLARKGIEEYKLSGN